MRITTEASLRRIVRRIISEGAGENVTVTVTNSMRSPITVVGVYYSDGDPATDQNLISTPVKIAVGDSESVAFAAPTQTTATDITYMIIATRFQGTGVTPGYNRGQLSVDYTLKADRSAGTAEFDISSTGSVEGSDDAPNPDYDDDVEMSDDDIKALAKTGESFEIMDDPTDAEFKYALFYVKTPTRAVVIRAPSEDYKGKKIVSSKGQEISPRRYGGSFRKIADAFIEKMKTP